jgi:hypothetical protein
LENTKLQIEKDKVLNDNNRLRKINHNLMEKLKEAFKEEIEASQDIFADSDFKEEDNGNPTQPSSTDNKKCDDNNNTNSA